MPEGPSVHAAAAAEDKLEKDRDGNVFFDYSPHVMMPLIEYLRLYRDWAPREVP